VFFKTDIIEIVIYIRVRWVFYSAKTRFQVRGEAERMISWRAVKYLPYIINLTNFGSVFAQET
jgi:hypothetical protein